MIFGSITGAIIGGWQSGKFGRKTSMMIDSVVYVVGLLFLTFSPSFYLALVSRFILGHAGASGLVSVPIYVGEISQPQIRQISSTLCVIFFSCGASMSLTLGKSERMEA